MKNAEVANVKKGVKKTVCISLLVVFLVCLVVTELFGRQIFGGLTWTESASAIATRMFGGAACLMFVYIYSSKRMLSEKPKVSDLVIFLPCLAVAVNNFPFIPYINGEAYIDAQPLAVLIYALICVSTAFFEELAFRGCIFTAILGYTKKGPLGVVLAIFLSSAFFGLAHAVNLFTGADPASVLLQIGYSFLIGGMCSVVLVKTSNIWYCVVLHAVYNFAGGIVPACGGGVIWDTPTVVLTASIAICVTAYVIYTLIKLNVSDVDRLLDCNKGE